MSLPRSRVWAEVLESLRQSNMPDVYVIDPSLFPGPVPRATWAGAQGDPAASVEASDADVFHRGRGGSSPEYDPTYSQTNGVLTRYRNELRLRSVGPNGRPPYLQCLTKPPRVQWFGMDHRQELDRGPRQVRGTLRHPQSVAGPTRLERVRRCQ
jgi:hypothetical protein